MASLTVRSEPEARRVALVTGAAVRIGRAIGLALGSATRAEFLALLDRLRP
jgi:NAD(P)-dependent dehydrogenase (short-subunit alcohol dehydrogenase family)